MDVKKNTLHFGGLPTDPDVKRIREKYPDDDLEVGRKISYQEIARLINEPVRSSRWTTVTQSWRKKVEAATNIIIGTCEGVNFIVLDDSQKVDLSESKLKTASRNARRAFIVSNKVDIANLSDSERARLDHQINVSAKIIASAKLKGKSDLPKLREAS